MQTVLIGLLLLVVFLSLLSFFRCKNGHFFSDVPFAWLLGVYVWGDGLVLFPFWGLMLLLALFLELDPLWLLRIVILFLTTRSYFEVIYWLQKQSSHSNFKPVLLRTVSWLSAEATQIVFQLLHFCAVVMGALLLLGSFLGR